MPKFSDTPKYLAHANPPLVFLRCLYPFKLADVYVRTLIVVLVDTHKRREGETLSGIVPIPVVFRFGHDGQIIIVLF